MEFEELPQALQKTFLDLLKEHAGVCAEMLQEGHSLEPMMRINGGAEPVLLSLQPQDGVVKMDRMMEKAKEILRTRKFETAALSYTSSSVLKKSETLVTFLFHKSGVAVLFFTAYHFSGLFRKKLVLDRHLVGEVFENAL